MLEGTFEAREDAMETDHRRKVGAFWRHLAVPSCLQLMHQPGVFRLFLVISQGRYSRPLGCSSCIRSVDVLDPLIYVTFGNIDIDDLTPHV